MTANSESDLTKLRALMTENGWDENTSLFRATLPEYLTRADGAGGWRLSANPEPTEAVVDVYGQGHTCLAQTIGPGLSFVDQADHEWRGGGRTAVSVRLGDVIEQGGRIYPVTTTINTRTWYLTLPSGAVTVRKA